MADDQELQSVEIRLAVPSDAPGLARLMGELGYPTTAEQMEARLALISKHPDYQTVVAAAGESLAGMIGIRSGMGYERDGILVQIIEPIDLSSLRFTVPSISRRDWFR